MVNAKAILEEELMIINYLKLGNKCFNVISKSISQKLSKYLDWNFNSPPSLANKNLSTTNKLTSQMFSYRQKESAEIKR